MVSLAFKICVLHHNLQAANVTGLDKNHGLENLR